MCILFDAYVFPNELNREFEPEAPNKAWATDMTYIHTGEGFIYLKLKRVGEGKRHIQ